MSATTASYLLVQPLAGWLADKVDPALTIIVGLAVAAGATLGIPAVTGWPLIPLAVAAGLGVGTVWTNTDMLVTRIAGDRQLGAAVGAAQSFKEVGGMLGLLAIGAIAQAWGVRVGFAVCAGAVLAVVVLFAILPPARSPVHDRWTAALARARNGRCRCGRSPCSCRQVHRNVVINEMLSSPTGPTPSSCVVNDGRSNEISARSLGRLFSVRNATPTEPPRR